MDKELYSALCTLWNLTIGDPTPSLERDIDGIREEYLEIKKAVEVLNERSLIDFSMLWTKD